MQATSLSLKQRIHSGDILIGVAVPLTASRSQLETILNKDGYTFISSDSQHAPYNEERLVEFCALAQEFGKPVVLRIKHTRHTYLVGNYLDLGPAGIEVPQVEEEATVEEGVENFYYPQRGKRSWGGVARWGINQHPGRLDYARWWNENGVLWMQLESLHSVTNARQLAKAGVDCLSWGPNDLQFNMEAYPEHPFKTDDECVAHVLKLLEGTGCRLVYRNFTPDLRNKYIDMGVTVLLERPR